MNVSNNVRIWTKQLTEKHHPVISYSQSMTQAEAQQTLKVLKVNDEKQMVKEIKRIVTDENITPKEAINLLG